MKRLRCALLGDGGRVQDPWVGWGGRTINDRGGSEEQSETNVHRHTLRVNGSKVGVLEEGDKVSLSGLLKSHDGRGLEEQIRLGARCQNRGELTRLDGNDSP